MEAFLDAVMQYSIGVYFVIAIGSLYAILVAGRSLIELITKYTPTKKDEKIVKVVYDFLEKNRKPLDVVKDKAKEAIKKSRKKK